jgi:cytochrome P450
MLLGGSQPASLAIAWALYCLTQHPDIAAQLECEVDRVLGARSASLDDLPQLPYTRAVLDEALRLYPPFFLLARDAVCNTELAGYRVPKGTTIFVSPWVTQRSERYFNEPLSFRPERWLDGRSAGLPRFAYFPFSEGPRVCVAQRFALTQSVLVLATLVRALRFELAPGHSVKPSPAIALGFARGLQLVVRQRVRL